MGFRAFLVMDNTIARQAMAENGGKWQKMVGNGFSRVLSHGHRGGQAGNGRKWLKMAENGGKMISAGKWQKMDFRVLSAIPLLLFSNSLSAIFESEYY